MREFQFPYVFYRAGTSARNSALYMLKNWRMSLVIASIFENPEEMEERKEVLSRMWRRRCDGLNEGGGRAAVAAATAGVKRKWRAALD